MIKVVMTKWGEIAFIGWLTAEMTLDSFGDLSAGYQMEILAYMP